jgi:signal transduction histidine kinase/ActR/RegA family two-component response regulator
MFRHMPSPVENEAALIMPETREFAALTRVPRVRWLMASAAVIAAVLMTLFEAIKSWADPSMSNWGSHGITIGFSTVIAAIGAGIVLRRQAKLHRQILAESSARARLEEVKKRLVDRTHELEESSRALEAEITERRRVEADLRQSDAMTRAVVDAIPDVVVRIGRDGFVRDAHVPADTDLAGIEHRAWLGRHVSDIFPVDVAVPALERITACLDGSGPQLFEFTLGAPPLSRSCEGRFVRRATDEALVLLRDITDRRRLETDLAQAQRMESVGRLAGGVAHDFNNLLTAIVAHADFALAELGTEQAAREDLVGIKGAAMLGAQLTKKLLSFARRQSVAPRPIELGALLGEMDVILRRTVGPMIEVRTTVPSGPTVVVADQGQMEQVLLNLAVNARDAMPMGGVLGIELVRLRVRDDGAHSYAALTNGQWIALTISDTGVGMDDATREHLFEPFFTTKEAGHGTGLGLAICYGIVTRAGGHIAVRSERGRGSSFTVYMPAAEAATLEGEAVVAVADLRGNESVLVVEDDPSVRQTAVRALQRHGYRVLTAIDGVEALDVIERNPGGVDLVLTDVLMPRMGGAELAERLLNLRPGLPVLFMSGYTADSLGPEDARHERLVSKPFTVETLLLAVRSAFTNQNA